MSTEVEYSLQSLIPSLVCRCTGDNGGIVQSTFSTSLDEIIRYVGRG